MRSRVLMATLLALFALTGCRGRTSEDSPVVVLRNMHFQPRYMPQAASLWFEDGRAMRAPVTGTISREMEIDPVVAEGRTADGTGYGDVVPAQAIRELGGWEGAVDRGEGRFGIYCVPCHDGIGNGKGTVPERAKNPAFNPASLHTDKVRTMPDGQLFATITHGVSNMPALGAQIPITDRWAIVAYVRALELSMASNKTGSDK